MGASTSKSSFFEKLSRMLMLRVNAQRKLSTSTKLAKPTPHSFLNLLSDLRCKAQYNGIKPSVVALIGSYVWQQMTWAEKYPYRALAWREQLNRDTPQNLIAMNKKHKIYSNLRDFQKGNDSLIHNFIISSNENMKVQKLKHRMRRKRATNQGRTEKDGHNSNTPSPPNTSQNSRNQNSFIIKRLSISNETLPIEENIRELRSGKKVKLQNSNVPSYIN
ncbi:uncharacterized protein LOC106665790 [Cimex lectularius]|uniref:Uncharacterized protein n=1 Tax=Cimex lectularius TaxID=79782 RepID=A0A8I6RQ07_CIMLE|nr:uncharacterized protein LOC106665790 [Cimex lectularius]